MNTLTAKKWVAPFADTNENPLKFQNFWVVPKGINAFFFFVNRVKTVKIEKNLCWEKVFYIDWRISPRKRFHWIALFISGIETHFGCFICKRDLHEWVFGRIIFFVIRWNRDCNIKVFIGYSIRFPLLSGIWSLRSNVTPEESRYFDFFLFSVTKKCLEKLKRMTHNHHERNLGFFNLPIKWGLLWNPQVVVPVKRKTCHICFW